MKAAFVLPKPPRVSLLGWGSCAMGLGGLQGAGVPHPCPPQEAQEPHFHLLEIPARPLRDPRSGAE